MGLDPSLRGTGIAFRLANGTLRASCIAAREDCRGLRRLAFICKAVEEHIDRYGCDVVAYENYAYSKGPSRSNNILHLAELGGVLKMLLYRRGIAILAVPPTSLKLFATGKGGGKDMAGKLGKEAVARYVADTEGVTFATSDQSDAAALLKVGEAKINARLLPRDRTHYQRRAVTGCVWL